MVGALSDDARLMSVWRLSIAYIGPKSRTERPRKTKIGTEVAHVTRDSTTFKVKRLKVNLQGAGAYYGGLTHSLFTFIFSFTAARPYALRFCAMLLTIADWLTTPL